MKKCPSCGSIAPDGDPSCGVCGTDLTGVFPMTQTIEQSEIEDETKRRTEDKLLTRQELKREALKFAAGVIVGSVILVLSLVFLSSWGLFLIPFGCVVLGVVIFGGLGRDGLGRAWVSRYTRSAREVMDEESDEERARRERESD